jgi:hypothetical protein
MVVQTIFNFLRPPILFFSREPITATNHNDGVDRIESAKERSHFERANLPFSQSRFGA